MNERPAYTQDLFTDPPLSCDIIMKGGITSGVVYPLAVCELAKQYRFRNIGGTSAGAIAAAAAAAAEFGRDKGGFIRFAALPDFFKDKLTSLFQPSRETRPVFTVLLTWIQPGKRFGKLWRSAFTMLRSHWLGGLLGAGVGLFLFCLFVVLPAAVLHPVGAWTVGVLFALVWGLLGALTAFVAGGLKAVQNNFFGLCTGMAPARPGADAPLTDWLADLLDKIAGKTDGPLTFADLWGPGTPDEMLRKEEDARLRNINLEVMTTNLTHGWPLRLPFASREFFFDPGDFERFFPPRIVEWMLRHPPRPRGDDEWLQEQVTRNTSLRPLPDPADLPVVVAARMSLSFPVLISAVPLYTVDWSRKKNQEAKRLDQPPELRNAGSPTAESAATSRYISSISSFRRVRPSASTCGRSIPTIRKISRTRTTTSGSPRGPDRASRRARRRSPACSPSWPRSYAPCRTGSTTPRPACPATGIGLSTFISRLTKEV